MIHVCINDSVQDCSISSANALEILQSCAKPLIWRVHYSITQDNAGYCQPWMIHVLNMPMILSQNTGGILSPDAHFSYMD